MKIDVAHYMYIFFKQSEFMHLFQHLFIKHLGHLNHHVSLYEYRQ
jgi:hypothetical protein